MSFTVFGVYAPWSDLPHHMDKQFTVPSLAVYACGRSASCVLLSHHYHLFWPTKKMVGILLLTCLDIGGLFLVAHISTWLLTLAPGCSVCASSFASLSACSFPGTPHWAGIHWRATLQLLLSSCRAFARCGNSLLVRACRTGSTSVRNTAMELFFFESTTEEMAFINYLVREHFELRNCGRNNGVDINSKSS